MQLVAELKCNSFHQDATGSIRAPNEQIFIRIIDLLLKFGQRKLIALQSKTVIMHGASKYCNRNLDGNKRIQEQYINENIQEPNV